MRLLVACFGVVLVCGLISQTACMTNREFVDSMMDSAEEVEESYPGDVGYDDEDEGAIELPGGPEDELDLEYLMIQTSLPEQLMAQLNSLSKSEPESSDLGWWRRRRRRRRARRPSTSCNCRSRSCHCCLRHTFSANLILKKVRFTLHACAYITYLPGEGVDIRFTMNSRNLYHKRISIRHPPGLCYGVPGLQYFAKVCLKFYNVDLRNKAFCLKLEGRLNLLVKKFRVNLKLGCYRIRDLTEEELQSLMNDSEALMTYLTSGDSAIETTGFDLTKTQSLRELMQHAEITEMYEDDETMEIE